MYSRDFHIIHLAHWKLDEKAVHGRTRVSLSLTKLLSVATATWPAALVEGTAAKSSNKALCWGHVLLKKARLAKDRGRSTIVALVNLEHIKNAESSGRRCAPCPYQDETRLADYEPSERNSSSALKARWGSASYRTL